MHICSHFLWPLENFCASISPGTQDVALWFHVKRWGVPCLSKEGLLLQSETLPLFFINIIIIVVFRCAAYLEKPLYASPSSHTSRSAQLHELAFAVRKSAPVLNSLLITLILWPLRVSQPASPLSELCDLDFFAPPTSFLVDIFSL